MAWDDLTDLADVHAYLQVGDDTFPNTDDGLLSRLITSASEFIRNYLNRRIALTDYQEVRIANGTQQFVFANQPVSRVMLVVVDGFTVPAIPSQIPAPPGFSVPITPFNTAGYWFTPTKLTIQGYIVPHRAQVTLQYTAGFPVVPFDIEQACIELVAMRYKERTRLGKTTDAISGVQTAGYRIVDLLPSTARALAPYRAVAPVLARSNVLAASATDTATLVGVL